MFNYFCFRIFFTVLYSLLMGQKMNSSMSSILLATVPIFLKSIVYSDFVVRQEGVNYTWALGVFSRNAGSSGKDRTLRSAAGFRVR
jgi:hypothetical protein